MTARTPTAARLRADACPGALQTHAAADGALARVRVPGGLLTGGQLRALAAAARDLGDGALELTSRGNVQLRGLADGAEAELGDRLAAVGLLPSASHERVRNVLASVLTGGQLRALAAAARDLGDGALELTSRGNVQLRGLTDGAEAELGDRLATVGLLPSASHERVRNVLASALTGRAGGHVDVRPWVRALDAGICADPALAALPGRYLATLDDGRGDVSGLGGDVGLLALSPSSVALLLDGVDSGLRAGPSDAGSRRCGAA